MSGHVQRCGRYRQAEPEGITLDAEFVVYVRQELGCGREWADLAEELGVSVNQLRDASGVSEDMTSGERRTARLLGEGYGNAEIGRMLGRSRRLAHAQAWKARRKGFLVPHPVTSRVHTGGSYKRRPPGWDGRNEATLKIEALMASGLTAAQARRAGGFTRGQVSGVAWRARKRREAESLLGSAGASHGASAAEAPQPHPET